MKGKKMESKDLQKLAAPRGPTYFFDTEKTADEAVYSFTVVLL